MQLSWALPEAGSRVKQLWNLEWAEGEATEPDRDQGPGVWKGQIGAGASKQGQIQQA